MHLWCSFYLDRPIFDQAQLGELQSIINEVLPSWSRGLCIAYHELKPPVPVNQSDSLWDCLHGVAAPKRGLSHAALFGDYQGVSCFLSHSERTLPPELNHFTFEICELESVEGRASSDWAKTAFEAIASRMSVRYANVRTDEEYYAKNMIDNETGTRAIGANFSRATPGLYWLNFFGRPYLDLIGRERLLSAPAFEVKPVDDGVLIALDASADAWQTPAYQHREQAVIEHLGKQYFFSRYDPDRVTVAPDFAAFRD